ncbi:MAG: vWA domain-containing protein [Cytophagales bacterium]|nr:MAG: aerotolerance regulator BatB [Rhodothermaeota bacterium MED-G16]
MNFLKSLDYSEFTLFFLFTIFYSIYIFRIYRINKKIEVSIKKVIYKLILRSSYFFLMIIALLGPSFGDNKKEVNIVGKDIMILVDLSESMNADDIKPTRLEKVKFEMKKIIDQFSSDRIGIIMFSSEAYVQCPLTYDKNALNLFIETLNTSLVPNSGTDFGPALELSLSKLEDETSNNKEINSKVIILISDGEDFGEDTESSLEQIKSSSIKLFSVGIGSAQGSKILLRNGKFKKDNEGNDVITKLNSNSLKETASYTGGKYFEISNEMSQTDNLISEIVNIKGDYIESKTVDVTENKYFYFLFSALILMLIDFTFSFKIISI